MAVTLSSLFCKQPTVIDVAGARIAGPDLVKLAVADSSQAVVEPTV